MSTHEVPVVRIEAINPHPNADALGLVSVFGWTCAVRLGQFAPGDLVVYIPPDYVVDVMRPEFAFLKDGRIKVKRLRGVYSQGLIVQAPVGLREGDNAMEALGVARYEPPVDMTTGGDNEAGPSGVVAPKYDVESLRRYPSVFEPGEYVIATEKIHGCNARYVWRNGRMYCGSRTNWKKDSVQSVWWNALRQDPGIAEWCEANEGTVLYGEVFGQVQDLKYGARKGELFFAAFDILHDGRWTFTDDAQLWLQESGVNWVPEVYRGPFNAAELTEMSDALDSQWCEADHLAEGIVIRPLLERFHPELGRVQLKLVSNRYLSR